MTVAGREGREKPLTLFADQALTIRTLMWGSSGMPLRVLVRVSYGAGP
jgi:hypothetical protein